MSKKPQIVHLSKDNEQFNDRSSIAMTRLVEKARSIALDLLERKLNAMLDTADDRLFDMADKTNEIVFFDSMRLVRIKRQGLITTFKHEFEHIFKRNLLKENQDIESDDAFSLHNISLVKEDDLEEDIAIDVMVNKSSAANGESLNHLATRLEALCSGASISEKTNPMGPRVICEAFRVGARELEMDIQSRLVIFKLFERCVIDNLYSVYDEVNQFFISEGVLPDLYRKPRKRSEANPRANRRMTDDPIQNERDFREQSDLQEEVFHSLQQLLAMHRPENHSSFTGGGNGNVGSPVIATDQLVNVLTDLQRDRGYTIDDLSSPNQLKQVIGGFLPATEGKINGGTIGQINDDVIDIVTMLFDFIMDDANIHNDIKTVLSRLQIPMLKVGIVDRSFFSTRNHPARRLLNELARSGIGWSPSRKGVLDPLLSKITEIVERVIDDFKDSTDLFQHLLTDFEKFKQTDLKRASIIETRMREAEEGRARSDKARKLVNGEISRMCHGRVIAAPVKSILKEAWRNVLFLERLKNDNQEQWEKAVRLAEFLVWSVQPKRNTESLEKLKKVMPSLIRNIKLGMDKISFDPFRSSQLLQELEDCHRIILNTPFDQQTEVNVKEEPEQLSPEASKMFSGDTLDAKAFNAIEPSIKLAITEKVTEKTLAELTLPEDKPSLAFDIALPDDCLIDLLEDDPVFHQIDELQAGSWVEVLQKNNDKQRCKLAAFIASNNKYIFVNRTGMKVVEFTREALARALASNIVKILDDSALFDRALESVITNLRSMKAKA